MICIETASFQEAMIRLSDCHADSGQDDNPQSMKLLGVAGVGKSFVFREYCLRHPSVVGDEITHVPVVRVSIPSAPSKKDIFAAFVRGIGAHVGSGTAAKFRYRVETLYVNSGVEFICVDEIQHLVDRGQAQTYAAAADALKEMLDLLKLPVAYGGAPRAEILFSHNGQLRSRVPETLRLHPFNPLAQLSELRSFLFELAHELNDENRQWLASAPVAMRMFYATDGVHRTIALMVKRIARLEKTEKSLDFPTLERMFKRNYWPQVTPELNPFHRTFRMRRLNGAGEPFQPTYLDGDNHEGEVYAQR